MLIGILSDSHGDAIATATAIRLLEARGVEYLVHCGDICSEAVLDDLAGHPCTFVWGNCDSPGPTMRKYLQSLGLAWPEPPVILELGGKRIAVFHGHERSFASVADRVDLDYVFYGHTHKYADRRVGRVRFINPGALHRAKPHTCALLDLRSGALTILRADNGEPVVRSS
jgi:putative phosphoesterase